MPIINGKHYTESEVAAIKREVSSSQFESFLVSGLIGAVTGSALLGGLLGGDLLGGILGDAVEGTDDSWFF